MYMQYKYGDGRDEEYVAIVSTTEYKDFSSFLFEN